MAFFIIRPRHFDKDLAETIKYLGLKKLEEGIYALENGNLLELKNGWYLEPKEK